MIITRTIHYCWPRDDSDKDKREDKDNDKITNMFRIYENDMT